MRWQLGYTLFRHWKAILAAFVGLPSLGAIWRVGWNALSALGNIDFVISRSQNPGWIGYMINLLLNSPLWLILSGIVIGYLLFRVDNRQSQDRWAGNLGIPSITIVIGTSVILFIMTGGLSYSSSISVDPLFRAAYTIHKKQLGRPVEPAIAMAPPKSLGTTIDRQDFEHAITLYLTKFSTIFVLKYDTTWFSQADLAAEEQWFNENHNRDALSLPPRCSPPVGGVAKQWHANPPKWNLIGCRLAWCGMQGASVLFQKFELGEVIGTIPTNKDDQRGQIVVLFNNPAKWEFVRTHQNAEGCHPLVSR